MKRFEGNGKEARQYVSQAYDKAADAYLEARKGGGVEILDCLLEGLKPGSHILDAGCGSGMPMAEAMMTKHRVTGVDISFRRIELARSNVPKANFIQGDLVEMSFPAGHIDACLMLYALFHIPRDEQEALMRRMRNWIRSGGGLLLTIAIDDEPGYTEADFFGTSMYWSNFSEKSTVKMLERSGFSMIREVETGHGYENRNLPDEMHRLLLMQAV